MTLRAGWTDDYFDRVFADRPLSVHYFPDGKIDVDVSTDSLVMEMPGVEFLDRIRAPDDVTKYYARLSAGASDKAFKPLFETLRDLSRSLPTMVQGGHVLDTLWFGGGGNITPLHHDPVSRLHGVLRGHKKFVLFPPDRRHMKALDVCPYRTNRRRASRLGLGPLDPEEFPGLSHARGFETLCGEGDFLYIPPCWWHYVTIPSEMTVTTSVAYRPPELYRTWAYWRLKLGRLLGEGAA